MSDQDSDYSSDSEFERGDLLYDIGEFKAGRYNGAWLPPKILAVLLLKRRHGSNYKNFIKNQLKQFGVYGPYQN